jgi:hypothetical protein
MRSPSEIRSVLLVGEASGVHRNLAKGLRTLGIDVKHMVQSDAPSWKWYDDVFAHNKPGWKGGVARNLEPFLTIARLPKFDVISFTNTITSVHGLYTRYLDLPLIRRKAALMSYYALGCDEIGLIRRNDKLPYSPCAGCLKYDTTLGEDCEKSLNPRWDKSNAIAKRYFDFGASSMMEYDHTSALFAEGAFARIPFPVDIDKIAFTPAQDRLRPLVVHTPTRRGFKGTEFVLEAVEKLRLVRDDFDFRIIEGLSYDDYVRSIVDADVVIDQIFSQSPGMNGLEMMAAGKVVMTGATEIGKSFTPAMARIPAFDASPDPYILARDLGAVLDRKNEFPDLAKAGRDYVAEVHDPVRIAGIFLDNWHRTLATQTATVAA